MDFNRMRRFGPSQSFSGGFFTNEVPRAGCFNGDPLGRDLMDRTLSAREVLRWEIEKQRIRAELVEADLARRRQIEEEVRREIAIEREIALRRERRMLESMIPVRKENRLLDSPMPETRTEGRFSLGSRPSREFGSVISQTRYESGDSDERRNPTPGVTEKSSVVVPTRPSSSTAVSLKRNTPLPTTAGCTAEAAGTEFPWLAIPRKKTKTTQSLWICTLCNISCTSEDGLADHRLGKKHRTKISESKGKIGDGGSDKTDAKALETDVNQSAGGPNNSTGAGKSSGLQRKSGHKKVKPNTVARAAIKQSTKVIKYAFWCELCGVGCNSNSLRDTHLKGKKHVRLSALKNSDVEGGAMQSVEIEVKQAGRSDAESMALLVPKGETGKESDTVNEGDMLSVC